ncbi:hypothetical protein IV203_009918 [Nitzschia inconspicua]|uniref:Uncharacterized protein n=1 Tax=Nitzschia inconspicua TaxID=303405 RepID=A0A9K3KV67_9STRA|nr:hypothetical protein IV203_009918 [Nitzschia inconspicua]
MVEGRNTSIFERGCEKNESTVTSPAQRSGNWNWPKITEPNQDTPNLIADRYMGMHLKKAKPKVLKMHPFTQSLLPNYRGRCILGEERN